MEKIKQKVLEQKRVCAWCKTVMADGFEPATHGICPVCFAKELKALLCVDEPIRPFVAPQVISG
jgi:hypothetical protein